MNDRERYIETLRYGKPDRIPLMPGAGRESTRKVWHSGGLPEGIERADIAEYAYRECGGTLPWPKQREGFPVNHRMIPLFEEKVIEERERSLVVQDWKGNICEIGKQYSVEYLRRAIDFVTRTWIRCPVESRKDWEAMQQRYDADEQGRLPANTGELGRKLADRDWVVKLSLSGPFFQLREWVGFEGLCLLFYDDPGLVREMLVFWERYIARLLERAFEHIVPDCVHISEDIAYKSHPMISPGMVREYILPVYRSWGELISQAGCPIYEVDSDGYIADLIPIWVEAGINVCNPMEVAAGNDLVAYQEAFGQTMAYRGGVDKRAMAKGGETLIQEIERLRPAIRSGGYIPGCDHGIPSDVSWPNFVGLTRLLAEETGWL